jgi:hypothetical protein
MGKTDAERQRAFRERKKYDEAFKAKERERKRKERERKRTLSQMRRQKEFGR